jgi:hypothetical protein
MLKRNPGFLFEDMFDEMKASFKDKLMFSGNGK